MTSIINFEWNRLNSMGLSFLLAMAILAAFILAMPDTAEAQGFTDLGTLGMEEVCEGSADWGDYDNDGDLDILLTGRLGTPAYTRFSDVYQNNAGSFTAISAGLSGVYRSSTAWGDYDNDGDLDILLTGSTGIAPYYRVSEVYRNNGDNTFTEIGAGLTAVENGSIDWGDYDNDGDLDILLTGYGYVGTNVRISKVYRNNGNHTFTDIGAGLIGLYRSSAAWGDYDNDGHLDILLAGRDASSNKHSLVYQNNGNDTFTNIEAELLGTEGSSVAWGDYDNDGDLDIFLSGFGTSVPISRVYENDSGSFTLKDTVQGVSRGSVDWGDYDNDGDLDILMTGDTWGDSPFSAIYNNDTGSFTSIGAGITAVCYGSSSWGDYDNDGDLDILINGIVSGTGPVSKIYRNDTAIANTPPLAPTGLWATTGTQSFTVGWNSGSDTQTPQNGLNYNLMVGTSDSTIDVCSPHSGTAAGYRRVPQLGNTNHNLSWPIRTYPQGKHYWSVQTIDTAWAGSPFAPGTIAWGYQLTLSNSGTMAGDDSLTWGNEFYSEVENYQIQIDDDPAFGSPEIDELVEPVTCSITLAEFANYTNLTELTTYYWRIKPIYTNGMNSVFTWKDIPSFYFKGQYKLTIACDPVGSGIMTLDPPGGWYSTGQIVTLTGSAVAGCVFNQWTGDLTGSTNPDTITMNSSKSVTAHFLNPRVTDLSPADDQLAVSPNIEPVITFNIPVSAGIGNIHIKRTDDDTTVESFAATATTINSNQVSISPGDLFDRDTGYYILVDSNAFHDGASNYYVGISDKQDWNFETGWFSDMGNLGLSGVCAGAVDFSDYDNDGDLDILLTGNTSSCQISNVYEYEAGTYIDIDACLPGVWRGSADWGDYDNDGDPDILLTGAAGSNDVAAVFQNNAGCFSDINAGLPAVYGGNTMWGDYDNDGDLDILLNGNNTPGRISEVYEYNSGSFTAINAGLPGVVGGSSWGDYDNDNDLDILLTGYTDGSPNIVTRFYECNSGTYTENAAISSQFTQVGYSSTDWGDYDNDGDLDILLIGKVYDSGTIVSEVYENDSGTFTNIDAGLQGLQRGSAQWGDYDNDGDLDILLTGYYSHGSLQHRSIVYRNNGNDTFTDITTNLINVWDSDAAWGDYDNDGDLDILLTGNAYADMMDCGETAKIYRNELPNPPGNCLDFDGMDEYVQVSDSPELNITNEITLESWVKMESLTSYPGIVAKGYGTTGGYSLHIRLDSTLWFELDESDGTRHYYNPTDQTVTIGSWTHLATTYDGSTLRIYLNGQEVGTGLAESFAIGAITSDIQIGTLPGFGLFDGQIDEVRIWNVARSGTQIRNNMNQPLQGNETGLVAYYNFDQSSGTILPNTVSGSHTGTLINMDTPTDWQESYAMVKPGTLAATNISYDSFTANWTAPIIGEVPTAYYLDVATDNAFTSMVGGYDDLNIGNATSSPVTGLLPGTEYHYRIRAYSSGITGQSQSSNVVSVTTSVMVKIYVALQGDNRPNPTGWQVPLTVEFFNPGSDVMTATPVHSFTATAVPEWILGGTKATAIVGPVNFGTYDIIVDSVTTLLNVKRNVGIW